MDYRQNSLDIIYESYVGLVLINLDTDEYVEIKNDMEKVCCDLGEIKKGAAAYMDIKRAKRRSRIHPVDVEMFEKMFDMEHILRVVSGKNKSALQNVRYRMEGEENYSWITMEVVAQRIPDSTGHWVSCGSRRSGSKLLALDESGRILTNMYGRILKINLTQDLCEKVHDSFLWQGEHDKFGSLKEFVRNYVGDGTVYPDDVDRVSKCLNRQFISEFFKDNSERFAVKYRRKLGEEYRWVMLEIIPAVNYRSDNEVFYMYFRDIHDEYSSSILQQEMLKFYSYKDALTHLSNRNSFNIMCDKYLGRTDKGSVGVIFNDVNKLKYVNDKFGHKEGDLYLQRIADLIGRQFGENVCYRISGDEFVVVIFDVTREHFSDMADRYGKMIHEMDEPPVAFGVCWEDEPESVDVVMAVAEKEMYEDKKLFYASHPEFKRRQQSDASQTELKSDGPFVERRSFGESKEREDRLFDALEQTITRHYMFKCDLDTNVTKWSKNAVEYFGLPGQYIYETERIWGSLVHPDDREAFSKDIEDVFSGRKKMHALEYRMKNRKGNYVVCTCKGLMTKRPDGTNESFVGMIVNHGIMDGVDAITGLHNQQEFSKFISKHVEKRDTFTIIEVGISMMNSINMIYGYSYGNDMLKRFAALLKNAVGGNGVVFRVDGAKFAICTKLYTRDKITALYRNIQDMAEAYEDESGSQIPLSVCGGVFICNRIGSDEDMIKRGVEYALERSKTDMHGELVFFEETGRQGDRERLDISSSIHKSVLNGMKGFFLCYQPIADSNTGYITGMEALLRWKSDKFGVVPPNMFIQWLELEPCFFDLGNWIIERALTDAKEIRKLRPDFMVNVNISATQLENKNFKQSVVDILEKTKYPPKYFCMELTERCKNLDIDYLREQLEFFRGLGIRIALDDFGTGNATLNLLSQLPIDELKVDMSFVKGIQDNKVNQVVVSAVMSCAHELGYASCIEGVENQDLFDYLHRYDSTYYQGYHFSKPVTLEEFKELLK